MILWEELKEFARSRGHNVVYLEMHRLENKARLGDVYEGITMPPEQGTIEWAIRQIRNGQKVIWTSNYQTFKLSPGGWTEGFNLNKNEFLGVRDNTRIPFNGWTIVEKKPIRPIWSEL